MQGVRAHQHNTTHTPAVQEESSRWSQTRRPAWSAPVVIVAICICTHVNFLADQAFNALPRLRQQSTSSPA